MQQLDERLKNHYATLSPQEQRVADFILDHFNDLIGYNSTDLARLCEVSKATVSRLFKRLGYHKYKDMHHELRTLRQSGMPLAVNQDVVGDNTLLARHYKQEIANLERWINSIDADQFAQVVEALASASRIMIIGMRNAYPVALHLRQQLLQARSGVQLLPLPGQTLSEELVDLTDSDLVIVVGFRRRPPVIASLLRLLQQQNIATLLMCEPQAQGIKSLARWQLSAPLDSVSAYDSYASANSLVSLLANALLHRMLSQGRQRIHQIAGLYQQLDEIEPR